MAVAVWLGRSGVALAMRHRLCGFHVQVQWPQKGGGTPGLRSCWNMTPFTFTCDAFVRRQLRSLHCVHHRSVLLPVSTKTATASFRARYDGVVASPRRTPVRPSAAAEAEADVASA